MDSITSAFLDRGGALLDRGWEEANRKEDITQRILENERRAIDDARRSVDEKAEQLKSLSHQSALIAGFSMVVLVESNYECTHTAIVAVFGISSSLVVGLMLTTMLNSTFLLVAISKYNPVDREIPFRDFWKTRCEEDWITALHCFMYGVPIFIVVLALVGWVNFGSLKPLDGKCFKMNACSYLGISASISGIAIVVFFYYLLHTYLKWTEFLKDSDPKLLVPEVAPNNTSQIALIRTG